MCKENHGVSNMVPAQVRLLGACLQQVPDAVRILVVTHRLTRKQEMNHNHMQRAQLVKRIISRNTCFVQYSFPFCIIQHLIVRGQGLRGRFVGGYHPANAQYSIVETRLARTSVARRPLGFFRGDNCDDTTHTKTS